MLQERVLEIIKEVAQENNIPEKKLKEAFSFIWKQTRTWLAQPDFPKVLIANFGTFIATYGKTTQAIKVLIRAYREGRVSENKFKEDFKKLWKIRRVAQSSYIRRHQIKINKRKKRWKN